MFCKWCGMESETSDVCSWCRKPFSTTAATLYTPTSTDTQPTPEDSPPAVEVIASKGTPERPAAPPVSPLGASYEDEIEDDLNPVPFAAPSRPTGTESTAAKPPPAPPVTPISPRSSPPPPTFTPPAASQRLGGGYTPVAPRQPADRPPLEAIPIKGKSAGTGAPPPIIPIARPSQPTPPPDEPTPAPAKQTPASEGIAPETAAPTGSPSLDQVPPVTLRATPSAPPSSPPVAPPRPAPAPMEEAPVEMTPPPMAAEPETLDLPPLMPAGDEEAEVTPIVTAGKRYDLGGGASSPPPATTTTMPRGGRTFYCRWCGMESDNPDQCSWCRRDLRNMPASGQGGKGPVITTTKGPVKGKAAPVRQPVVTAKPATVAPKQAPSPSPSQPQRPAQTPASNGAPTLGTFQAQKSKYYADKVMDTVSGTHYDADTGQAVDANVQMVEDLARDERQEQIKSTANYLGSLALLATLASVAVHFVPSWYLGLMAVSNFAACMLMTVMRVVPFSDDDSSDMPLALALFLLAGPFVGFIAYIILGIMKQDANPAIVGIFITYLCIRIPLDTELLSPSCSRCRLPTSLRLVWQRCG